MTHLDQTKKRLLSEALDQGLATIALLTDTPGVRLPEHLLKQSTVVLKLSRKFPHPIELTEAGISTKLSFNQQTADVFVPWGAMWLIRDREKKNCVFPEIACVKNPGSVELETETLVDRTTELGLADVIPGGGELTPPKRGHLKLVN